ncbi:hypothetical protein [Alcaligenes faecalis]|uniref:hypothetical protein n=1 Tax=Alcaligenes faecalis TaxID=511 RepID=UPI000B4DD9DC|nr:hypothetical protein [Alcaligenes faecalis]ASC89057.1 hypothetical protein CDA61_01015 [Alcaligenes faecalis]
MRPPNRPQEGAALAWGLIALALLSVAWGGYFHVNQIAEQQGRLSLVLDAAAYGAATEQARTLNLLAYINRAQLGHQLALGHLLTLATWDRAAQTQSGQARRANPPVHLVSMMFGSAHGLAYTQARSAGDNQQALEQAFQAHQRLIHDVLAQAQEQLVEGLPQRRQAIIQATLDGSLPDWPAQVIRWQFEQDDWPQFLLLQSGQAQWQSGLAHLVSLYRFLAPRDYEARSYPGVDRRCPLWQHRLRRAGRTEFDRSGRWHSNDTQSMHMVRSNRWIGCYFREYAMAWALQTPTHASGIDAPDDFSGQSFWKWALEQGNSSLLSAQGNTVAQSWARRDARPWSQRSWVDGYALADSEQSAGPDLVLSLQAQGHLGQTVHTRAAAQSFFSLPPDRADSGVDAKPSLFLPFWQARLMDAGGRQL